MSEQQNSKKKKNDEEDLSDEDKALKEALELAVTRVFDEEDGIRQNALKIITSEIRGATSTMTAVPKPLKFLRPHYDALKNFYRTLDASDSSKKEYADALSVMAMTMAHGTGESLSFKLEGNSADLGTWGHEYVRNLSGELGTEFQRRRDESLDTANLVAMIDLIVPFHIAHNAAHEAVDLLMDTEDVRKIAGFVDAENFDRVTTYLIACAGYLPEPEDKQLLGVAYDIFGKFDQKSAQLRLALQLSDSVGAQKVFDESGPPNSAMRKQLGYILARQYRFSAYEEDDTEDQELLSKIVGNGFRSEYFKYVATDLDVMAAKEPDDVYKIELQERVASSSTSARQNLASSIVNGWINCGFGSDKLMSEDGNKAIYKNKDNGQICATASLGLIHLWDPDVGCNELDAYSYTDNNNVKAGVMLGVGVANAQVKNPFETAMGMLSEGVAEDANITVRINSALGMGIAYAGTCREDIAEFLTPILEEENASMELVACAALALGMVYTGSANADISSQIIENGFFGRTQTDIESPTSRLMCLGLGLVFLGTGESSDVAVQTVRAIVESEVMREYAAITVEACAYTGSGDVIQVQRMMHIVTDHLESNDAHQVAAVLGIAQIALGEDLGAQMALRSLDHILVFGEASLRRGVPLAIALLNVGNPDISVLEKLHRLTHDNDTLVAQNAIFSLGVIGAGTNNSRIAQVLRGLADYNSSDPNLLFCVRLAQGLLHLGKGMVSLKPFQSHGRVMNPVAMAGLLTTLHCCLDFDNLVLARPYYLFSLALGFHPRMMVTLDEEGNMLNVDVRVGKAVDTVGQAGRRKKITGFQTYKSPVLLSHGERVELASDEYIALSDVLEDVVILRKNPDFEKEDDN